MRMKTTRTMTLGEWKAKLGDAMPLRAVPAAIGWTSLEVQRAIRAGELPVHSFRAGDGRAFHMVRIADLPKAKHNRQRTKLEPQISKEGLARAFRAMVSS